MTDKAFRKNLARLIQEIYDVDSLVCLSILPGEMPLIAVIEEQEVICKILTHLGL